MKAVFKNKWFRCLACNAFANPTIIFSLDSLPELICHQCGKSHDFAVIEEPDETPVVRHKDARLLREGISKVYNLVRDPVVQIYTTAVLRNYAKAVLPYCRHPEAAWVERERVYKCLDCYTVIDEN